MRSLAIVVVCSILLFPVASAGAEASASTHAAPVPDRALGLADVLVRALGAGPVEGPIRAAEAAVAAARRADAPDAAKFLPQETRNLAAARDLLGVAAGDAPPLAEAVALAQRASAWQLAALGVPAAPAPHGPRYALPSDALFELAARRGVALDAEQVAGTRALDALAEPTRGALLGVVDAFLTLDDATREEFAGVDLTLVAPGEPWAALVDAGVDVARIVAARDALVRAAVTVDIIGDIPDVNPPPITLEACPAYSIELSGLQVTTPPTSNLYDVDCALIIDTGGDELYLNNAGGTGTADQSCSLGRVPPAAAVIDLVGNDRYGSGSRLCGANGGANGGVGFLFDGLGDDVYVAQGTGVNGGATAGFGFLLDAAGSDLYSGGDFGVNGGAGLGGAGMLIDGIGSDTYRAGSSGVNGGGSGGVGFLLDGEGHESYDAGGGGVNGGAALGVGFLLDGLGDDRYSAGGGQTNGGGGLGAGFLLDAAGIDLYEAGGGATNGGANGGVGLLVDALGSDTYTAGSQYTNGGGGLGFGFLVDGDGHDSYVAGDSGTNGGGSAGFGFLLDGLGNDRYSGGTGGANGGATVGEGFLLDVAGDDVYSGASQGVNGGGYAGGAGVLLDLLGNDQYDAGSSGTNGGANAGSGFLFDRAGNDAYRAGSGGANGAAELGAGMLLDGGGDDAYSDSEWGCNGSGTDRTVLPKCTAGAQYDTLLPSGTGTKLKNESDGSCTVYEDANGNGVEDGNERFANVPCRVPNLRTHTNPDGSITLYDDRDNDGQMDPGEEVVRLSAYVAVDGDCTSQTPPTVQACWRGDPSATGAGVSTCYQGRTQVEVGGQTYTSSDAGGPACLVADNVLGSGGPTGLATADSCQEDGRAYARVLATEVFSAEAGAASCLLPRARFDP